jgi:hypothetical protein
MLISHSHKFIFIHVYKTAGTSIRKKLAPYSHAKPSANFLHRLINPNESVFSNKFNTHSSAAELKKQIPAKIWNSYFKFGIVRNPWDWQVSLYTYMLKTQETHPQGSLVNKLSDFDSYIDWRVNNDVHLQKEYLYDMQTNKPLVDYIGRFENLQSDFDHICKTVGLPQTQLTVENVSNKKNFREYYNEKSKAIVAKVFNDDIQTFDYKFDAS